VNQRPTSIGPLSVVIVLLLTLCFYSLHGIATTVGTYTYIIVEQLHSHSLSSANYRNHGLLTGVQDVIEMTYVTAPTTMPLLQTLHPWS